MNILLFIVASTILVVVFHLVFPTKDFDLFMLVSAFAVGGIAGYYMQSIEIAFLISIVLSLLFV